MPRRSSKLAQRAAERGAQAVVFPELALNGYPPRDLVEKQSFLDRTEEQVERIAAATATLDVAVIFGCVARAHAAAGKQITNSALVVQGGKIVFRQNKMLLPTYDVFDEARYFRPADRQELFTL